MSCSIELVRTLPNGAGSYIRIAGTLDETFERAKLISLARGVVLLDLDELRRITSFGVREWVIAMKEIKAAYVGLTRCRPGFVTQLNTVSSFGARTEVLDIYAPFMTADGQEFEILVDLTATHAASLLSEPPKGSHPATGEPGEFDDEPASYFSYVAARPTPRPPALLSQLQDSGQTTRNETCRVQKEILADLTAFWFFGPLDKPLKLRRLAEGLEGEVLLIMDGVTRVSPEGLRSLSPIVTAPGVRASFARILEHQVPDVIQAYGSRANVVSCLINGERGLTEAYKSAAGVTPASTSSTVAALLVEKSPPVAAFLAARTEITSGGSSRQTTPPPRSVGKYEILDLIASGGMAQVYRARQRGLADFQKIVAVKHIIPHHARNAQFVEMFTQEARLSAHVHHPNVVDVYELDHDGESYFIAMEYVNGVDLRSVLNAVQQRAELMPLEFALGISRDVCAGLHAAHIATNHDGRALGIVHRDVSPRNILISIDGVAKVTDFGIAKAMEAVTTGTDPGVFKGKIPYLAPEQITQASPVTPATDIFALGVVLFEMVGGVHPFKGATKYDVIHAIARGPRPSVRSFRPECPVGIDNLIQRALAVSPTDRFPSADALRSELDAMLQRASSATSFNAARLGAWLTDLTGRGAPNTEILVELDPESNQ